MLMKSHGRLPCCYLLCPNDQIKSTSLLMDQLSTNDQQKGQSWQAAVSLSTKKRGKCQFLRIATLSCIGRFAKNTAETSSLCRKSMANQEYMFWKAAWFSGKKHQAISITCSMIFTSSSVPSAPCPIQEADLRPCGCPQILPLILRTPHTMNDNGRL